MLPSSRVKKLAWIHPSVYRVSTMDEARNEARKTGLLTNQPITIFNFSSTMNLALPKTLTSLCLLSLSMANISHAASESPFSPDILIINAGIHTMDAARPTAGALAIVGDRIAAVGSTAEIRALAGSKTRIIDAGQKLVLPGFNDSHVHFLTGGYSLSEVDLRDAKSPEELAKRLGEYARKLPKGRWILRGDWDHEKWPGALLPSRETIDAATPDHPVFVSRLDGHMALANSLALKLAGVNKETKDPPGGVVVKDANGE